eukprot:5986184-Amphidinium_carterae.1
MELVTSDLFLNVVQQLAEHARISAPQCVMCACQHNREFVRSFCEGGQDVIVYCSCAAWHCRIPVPFAILQWLMRALSKVLPVSRKEENVAGTRAFALTIECAVSTLQTPRHSSEALCCSTFAVPLLD